MKDNYGNLVDEKNLVLLPDIKTLDDKQIGIVVDADWYDVILENEMVFLCADFDKIFQLSEESLDGISYSPISEIMRINDVLKRWSEEDGFYHA